MPTLRTPVLEDFPAEERVVIERIAKRTGQTAAQLLAPGIFGVQAHWPAWLEANLEQGLTTYMARGKLPPIAKEAMHVAVSMTNHCEY